jgi:phage shock protein C
MKLERSSYNIVIGGVCGGIGRYTGIDPTIIRLIWALCIFMFGFGFILYILCWIIIPISYEY